LKIGHSEAIQEYKSIFRCCIKYICWFLYKFDFLQI